MIDRLDWGDDDALAAVRVAAKYLNDCGTADSAIEAMQLVWLAWHAGYRGTALRTSAINRAKDWYYLQSGMKKTQAADGSRKREPKAFLVDDLDQWPATRSHLDEYEADELLEWWFREIRRRIEATESGPALAWVVDAVREGHRTVLELVEWSGEDVETATAAYQTFRRRARQVLEDMDERD